MHFVRSSQIDLLKGIAIICVILMHTVTRSVMASVFSQIFVVLPLAMPGPFDIILNFTIDQAVPIFLVLIGWNLHVTDAKSYIIKRLKRILLPGAPVFAISYIFGVHGPGEYFVYILLGLAILAPAMVFLYRRNPLVLLITTFIINFWFSYKFLLPSSYFQYQFDLDALEAFRGIFAVALGMYLRSYSPKFLLWTVPISVLVLVFSKTMINFGWNALTFFYPAFIVVAVLNSNIKNPFLEITGRASYHIFLFQMLYFGFGYSLSQHLSGVFIFFGLIADVLISVIFGIAWYRLDRLIVQSLNRFHAQVSS